MFERYLQLFCDTSFFYACLDKSDADHLSAIEVAKEISRIPCAAVQLGMSSVKH